MKHQATEIFEDVRDEIMKDFTIHDQMRIRAARSPDEEFEEILMREMPQLYNLLRGITGGMGGLK